MKQPLSTRLFSATFSLVALASWLLASNHCALAGMMPLPQEAAVTSHCHGSPEAPAPADEERDCDGSKCCKSLSVPSLAFAKTVVSYDTTLFTATDYPAFSVRALGSEHDSVIAEIDTGPPRSDSFAESVLQRSILAHAPPALV